MSEPQQTMVLGLLGTVLDRGDGPERWNQWRPTLSLFQHPDLKIDRYACIVEPKHMELARLLSQDIHHVSPETEVTLHELPFEDPWDFEEVFGKLHTFAREQTFDPGQTRYLIHITTGSHVQQICLFLLTESRHFPGALIQTAPPKRSGSSTSGRYSIIHLDLSRYDQLAARFQQETQEALDFLKAGIPTRNPGFNRLMEEIEQVATHSRSPILLTGPTGSGKSHLARRIYELKRTRHQLRGNLVEVNCATLRGDAARSALFGHVRGAFTGAQRARQGHLLCADGGVLFLDEIAELGADEQAMLLKAIEEHRFHPVGSDSEVKSDFQLIAGTNQDLKKLVSDGRFRDDLLARIQLWSFELPPLRHRLEDIEPNLEFELDQFARNNGHRLIFHRDARQRFLNFATSPEGVWAGNFRDLNAAICRMATLGRGCGGRITRNLVDAEIQRLRRQWTSELPTATTAQTADTTSNETLLPSDECRLSVSEIQASLPSSLKGGLDPFDVVQLAYVISVCKQSPSISEAGRRLYSVSRTRRKTPNDADRLRKYLLRFGLTWSDL